MASHEYGTFICFVLHFQISVILFIRPEKKGTFFAFWVCYLLRFLWQEEWSNLSLGTKKNLFRVVPGSFIYGYTFKKSKVLLKARHKPEQKEKKLHRKYAFASPYEAFFMCYEALAASLASLDALVSKSVTLSTSSDKL